MRQNFFIFLFLLIIVLLFIHGYQYSYFQQDEWGGFGTIISISGQPFFSWITAMVGVHFVPLANLIWLIIYLLYGFNVLPYIIVGTVLHVVASFLVYSLTTRLSKSKSIGILTALLFATNGRAVQAFTHLSIFPSTLTSFICIITFFLLIAYKKNNKFSFKEEIILLLIFLFSVMFREDGLIIIPLFPAYLYFFKRKSLSKENVKFFLFFYSFTFSYFLFRFFLQLKDQSIVSVGSTGYVHALIYNTLTLPGKLFIQNIIDLEFFYMLVWNNKYFWYHVDFPQTVMDTLGVDFIILVLLLFFGVIASFLSRLFSFKQFKKQIGFAFFWIIVSALLLSTVGRQLNQVEPRYLYLSSFMALFIVSLTLSTVWRSNRFSYLIKPIIVGIVLIYLFTSYFKIQRIIIQNNEVSQARKTILSSLKREIPSLPKKTIIFVSCKKECYSNSHFGLPNNIVLPFSSGPGWIILLQYVNQNRSAYAPFFLSEGGKFFLWDMGSQGYKEKGKYGFGYFIDKKLLDKSLDSYKSDIQVIYLEYNEMKFILEKK